jgi:DNA-binding beta-propeller fold protein YncE
MTDWIILEWTPRANVSLSPRWVRQNTVEVIDLKSNTRTSSIPGQSKPHGVFYSPDFKKLFVARGTDGTCKVFAGDTFKLVDNLSIGTDAT